MSEILFATDEEMREKLKIYNFSFYDKKRNLKPFYYKGIHVNGRSVVCKPIGYEISNGYETLLIEVEDNRYKISFDYFKEMQSNNFKLNKSQNGE